MAGVRVRSFRCSCYEIIIIIILCTTQTEKDPINNTLLKITVLLTPDLLNSARYGTIGPQEVQKTSARYFTSAIFFWLRQEVKDSLWVFNFLVRLNECRKRWTFGASVQATPYG